MIKRTLNTRARDVFPTATSETLSGRVNKCHFAEPGTNEMFIQHHGCFSTELPEVQMDGKSIPLSSSFSGMVKLLTDEDNWQSFDEPRSVR